jgi:Zn-dependent protease
VALAGQNLISFIGLILGLVVGITVHEFTHAYLADAFGDHRVRALGRVSLNPLRHLDPLGTVLLLLVGFGWGKPVPVNELALRPPRTAMAMVAAGGPLANLAVASVFALSFRLLQFSGLGTFDLANVLYMAVFINVALAILNIIPVPPLDGYNAVLPFLPPRWAWMVRRYANYGIIVVFVLLILPNSPLRALLDLAQPIAIFLVGG